MMGAYQPPRAGSCLCWKSKAVQGLEVNETSASSSRSTCLQSLASDQALPPRPFKFAFSPLTWAGKDGSTSIPALGAQGEGHAFRFENESASGRSHERAQGPPGRLCPHRLLPVTWEGVGVALPYVLCSQSATDGNTSFAIKKTKITHPTCKFDS